MKDSFQSFKLNKTLIVLIVITALVLAGLSGYILGLKENGQSKVSPPPTNRDIGCTYEAKECPDGSYVGRVGPNCEFEKCPPLLITPPPTDDGLACTMEAKECPDGSYVGRTGPNCEFEKCPGVK